MADGSDDMMRTRIDASSARLTSLRTTTTEATTAAARRPKFVPKAAKRRTGGDEAGAAAGDGSATQRTEHSGTRGDTSHNKPQRAGDLTRDSRGRSGRGSGGGDGGRGGGRGRGRGRGATLPTGRVAFVGTLSGGSSYSSGGSLAPRSAVPSKPLSAADGGGISVLDDENGAGLHDGFSAMEVEEQWPPVVKSAMEPMSLPFARRPEPPTAGAVFCDPDGQFLLPNDTLLFLQLPTTLPLANATRVATSRQQQDGEAAKPEPKAVNKFAVAQEEVAARETVKTEEDLNPEEIADQTPQTRAYDRSIATAPGGFVGKLCVLRSGKVVLMLGDKKFDVATAHTPAFSEELFSIDKNEQQLCMLGPIDRHLVVTPDFDALLA